MQADDGTTLFSDDCLLLAVSFKLVYRSCFSRSTCPAAIMRPKRPVFRFHNKQTGELASTSRAIVVADLVKRFWGQTFQRRGMLKIIVESL